MIDGIKIFDGHLHYIGRFKPRDESLIQYMDRYGIDKAAVTTLNQAANLNAILKTNENINEIDFMNDFLREKQYDHEPLKNIILKNPNKLIGFFWFNPKIATDDDWKLLQQYIEKYHFKGVKTQWCVDSLDVPEDFYYLADFCIDHISTSSFYANAADLELRLLALNQMLFFTMNILKRNAPRHYASTVRRKWLVIPAQLITRNGHRILKLPEQYAYKHEWDQYQTNIART